VKTEEELIEALRKTLGCPFITERRSPSDRAENYACARP
jgi:hypothetical protein